MIRINALGGLSILGADGRPISGAAAQPRRMAILVLLARAGQRGVTREKLLTLLWPDAGDERGPRNLTQALYALRRDLGAEEAITGAKELRLDPALVSSDIQEFSSAVARGDDERAVSLFHGPFLDGFHLQDAEEFSRWIERERSAIEADHSRALESLARAARAAGDIETSITWWRKLAALEPLNARVTVGLMEALAASGDRAGALQHARVYEVLLEQELDLPPDKEVLDVADRLRREASDPVPTPLVIEQSPGPDAVPPAAAAPRRRSRRALVGVGVVLVMVIAGGLVALARRTSQSQGNADDRAPIIAIGDIRAFGGDSARANLTAPVADLLTTNLARARNIRVVSRGRMLELMHTSANSNDTTTGRFVSAARLAGATEIVDGTLYSRPDGRLRLDLRRIDLASGAIGDAQTVEGDDLFALVDSGTTHLVAAFGGVAPAGSVADVTTRSVTAYRMYTEGIRAYYRGDERAALHFFDAALAEDSMFAMAAYYGALAGPEPRAYVTRMRRARALAAHASDRERLIILVGWAFQSSSPDLEAIAETLATRYPTEVEGHLYRGVARVSKGEFLAGLDPLQRAVRMDSAGLNGTRPRCGGCDALQWIVGAYTAADSLPAAEREAFRWVRLEPTSSVAAIGLAYTLSLAGKEREADSVLRAGVSSVLPPEQTLGLRSAFLIRAGKYVAADELLALALRDSNPGRQADALWNLVLSLREQGRMKEALAAARRSRIAAARSTGQQSNRAPINVLEAQMLLEMGRPAAAATLFDSLAAQRMTEDTPSAEARTTALMLTHAADARFAAGDTSLLSKLADSIRVMGDRSGYGRDRRLHHHVRGLILAARGADSAAISEFKSAVYSWTVGFTRTNYELARLYLRHGQAREAVAVLQPALRGALDASNLYVSRTELHERLAQAWEAAGQPDSAAAHYAWVVHAWSAADPFLQPRVTAARARLVAPRRR